MLKQVGMVTGIMASVSLAAFADEMKIGFVDLDKAFQSVSAGKKVREELEKEFNAKKKSLSAEEEAVRKMSEDFQKQSLAMNEEARGKRAQEIQQRYGKLQNLTEKYRAEFVEMQKSRTEPIVTKMRKIISDMGEKRSLAGVLNKSENAGLVLYVAEKLDLTSELINAYEQSK